MCLMRLTIALALTLAASPGLARVAHHRHHHHRRPTHDLAALPPAPVPAPDPNAPAPAPVPNVDATPPQKILPPDRASLEPGNLQLHFPPVGEGFLPGSSSEQMDNERAPVVPGVSIEIPLSQTPPRGAGSDQPAP
jgi:hypothetical protein